jgi:hypothetical protein
MSVTIIGGSDTIGLAEMCEFGARVRQPKRKRVYIGRLAQELGYILMVSQPMRVSTGTEHLPDYSYKYVNEYLCVD